MTFLASELSCVLQWMSLTALAEFIGGNIEENGLPKFIR